MSVVTRSDGPVNGDAAMQYRTAAVAQQVPHDRAIVVLKRVAAAEPVRAHTDTTVSAMPMENHQK